MSALLDRITIEEGKCGGKPCIRGMRMRVQDVLEMLVAGSPNKTIAYDLGISARTVEVHRARVMEKMQVRSLSALVRIAIAAGIEPA